MLRSSEGAQFYWLLDRPYCVRCISATDACNVLVNLEQSRFGEVEKKGAD